MASANAFNSDNARKKCRLVVLNIPFSVPPHKFVVLVLFTSYVFVPCFVKRVLNAYANCIDSGPTTQFT